MAQILLCVLPDGQVRAVTAALPLTAWRTTVPLPDSGRLVDATTTINQTLAGAPGNHSPDPGPVRAAKLSGARPS
ncbi:MAG: hypothetical protein H6842_04665 [Rhodospirillaceae bacterium]|nr:hypothetical protein [Rhodospirillaceae bacterium]